MGHARRLAEDLEGIEIAIGIEGVAGVVGGDRDINPRSLQFVQQRHAARARGAAGNTILKIEIAHRQRHHGDAGFGHLVDGGLDLVLLLPGEGTAMADRDLAGEAMAQGRLGDVAQGTGGGVLGLVDVEIEVEAIIGGETEQRVQALVKLRQHIGDAAQDAVMCAQGCDDVRHMRTIGHVLDGEQRHRLQLDTAGPFFSHVGKDRPGNADLLADRIEMGADGRRAMRIGAAQREIHAGGDVGGRPIGFAIQGDVVERAEEGAVGIAATRPDMALVEMGVQFHEAREHHAGRERVGGARHGLDRLDAAVGDGQADARQAVLVDAGKLLRYQAGWHAGLDRPAAGGWDLGG